MPSKKSLDKNKSNALSTRIISWNQGEFLKPSRDGLKEVKMDSQLVRTSSRTKEIGLTDISNRFIEMDEIGNISTDGIKKLESLGISIAQKTDDANATYRRMWGIVQPEYNVLEPFTIFDSEPFVRQAINRKISLMFRNGFEFTGDNDPDISYIQRRYESMEYVMERTTESFFKQILFNLLLCSNCFLKKIRKQSATPVTRKEDADKDPVAGYLLIPAHMIFPYMENGIPVKWRRFFDNGSPWEDIDLDDIVHLKWDVKPGHRYGTPRLIGVKEDIFALRRLEENVELLFVNFLFPLFHVSVGTETNPAGYDGESGMSEVDVIQWQIQQMPKEGVFVTDERVTVEAVGSEGKALEYANLIDHYKSRIFIGLGMSAIDMGDSKGAGSRSTADNISQNLKDSIKSDLESFGGMVRMSMFKEFFMEATYSVSVQRAVARTWIHFHEIDLDNKIKYENHVIQLFLNNLIDEDEARKYIGNRAFKDAQRKKLNFTLHTVQLVKETEKAKAESAIKISEAATEQQKELMPLQTEHAEKQANTQIKLSANQTAHHERKAKASIELLGKKIEHAKAVGAPQRATAKKSSPGAKAVQNKTTPTNQHGSNLGPTKAKSSLENIASEWTDDLVQLMEASKDSNGTIDHEKYQEKVSGVLENTIDRIEKETGTLEEFSYTRQARMVLDKFRSIVITTYDPELISILATSILEGSEGSIEAEDENESEFKSDESPTE